MAGLGTYRKKRDFSKTREPRGAPLAKTGHRYVIQKHAATRLHYDLRLELDGAMLSWAVTRGPSLDPSEKRLAIHVEDHPIEYNKFEGTIPKGEYGGGTVMIWDRGTWIPEHDPHKGLQKGHLDFELHGEKLKGRWHLVRMRKRPGEKQEPWLLIKATDEYASAKRDPDILEEMPDSAASGRTMDEIATGKKRVWHSSRPKGSGQTATQRKIAAAAPAAKPRRGTPRAKSTPRRKGKNSVSGEKTGRMPDFIPPCLATLSDVAPAGSEWVHEIKLDGYRIQARIADGGVTLKTRTGLDWTKRFPTVAEACAALDRHEAILDGEIVSPDENGISDFSALQDDLKSGRHDRLVYYVFDLLYLDGVDLTGSALIDRKDLLAQLLSGPPKDGVIRLSESIEASGPVMLKHACQMHLEGIVSKRRDAPYHSGRVGDWLKTKCTSAQELVVLGYEPSDKTKRQIRSLLLGYYENGELRYAGRVGTGWGEQQERELARRLAAVARKTPPLHPVPAVERRKKVKWVEPRIVAEIEFRGWTGDRLVRQASFKGTREDKPAQQVVREIGQMPEKIKAKQAALRQKPAAKTTGEPTAKADVKSNTKSKPVIKPGLVAVAGVTLSHPDRVYWEDAGVTKQMLAEYYETVWDLMRPHATNRVLALLRCPEGAGHQCFFQKHASAGIDAKYLKLVPDDGDKSIAIEDLGGLVALVQAGALEIHLRGSSIDRLEEADRLVFDLDPGPGVDWKSLVAAAREVRERLGEMKLDSFVKTTGGKGLHVVLPIRPAPWDDAKDFCRKLAEAMAADSPDRYTATIKKTARNNRIFIDYLRNSREATAIAPYSTRARPGASVATPVSWQELGSLKAANVFTVLNIGKRLSRQRQDLWQDMGRIKQRLPDDAKPRTANRKQA